MRHLLSLMAVVSLMLATMTPLAALGVRSPLPAASGPQASANQHWMTNTLSPGAPFGAPQPATATDQTLRTRADSAEGRISGLFNCSLVTVIPEAECEALVALYDSADGPNWSNQTNWLANNVPCSWYGVSCDLGHVTSLDLAANQLSGGVPPELGDLTALQYLDLRDNQLSGPLPLALEDLALSTFAFSDTNLCEPADPAFQAWLAGISNLQRTGVICPVPVALAPGWNLISLPLAPSNSAVTETLRSITGSYNLVDAYNAFDTGDPWKRYDTGVLPFINDLQVITESMGLWLNVTSPVSVSLLVTGALPLAPSIPLTVGWNLVGYPSQVTRPVTVALSSCSGKYNLVDAYDAFDTGDPWKRYDTSVLPFINDLQDMAPGFGYWINMTQACTWNVP